MRFAFTADQLASRENLRALLRRECAPSRVRAAWSTPDGRVPGLWRALADFGLFGVLAPLSRGGLGLGELDLVLLLEECGRFAAPGNMGDTTAVVVPLMRDLAPQLHWLRPLATGEAGAAIGVGETPLVLDAGSADLLVLQHEGEIHAVERAATELDPQPSIDGSRRLFRVRWKASSATRIAHREAAQVALADARDRGAVAAAAELLGLARHLLETTVDYVKTRQQFGRPIGSFQAVKHHLADSVVAVEMAGPAVYRAAHSLAHDAPGRSVHASMAKALASDAAVLVARKALQCHGAIGYAFENDLHLWMKRVWALSAAWGDAASHRAAVAATLLAAGGT